MFREQIKGHQSAHVGICWVVFYLDTQKRLKRAREDAFTSVGSVKGHDTGCMTHMHMYAEVLLIVQDSSHLLAGEKRSP